MISILGFSRRTFLVCQVILALSYVQGYHVQGPRVVPKAPQAVYCSGAGIYFWWQLGCAKYIKEQCDIEKMPKLIGASAGAITATLLLSNTDLNTVADTALDLSYKTGLFDRKTGLAGVWGDLVRRWLYEVIPDDVNKETYKNLEIALTPVSVGGKERFKPKLVSGFENKADVIDAVMASCHVPIFLDGRPCTEYRDEKVIDGSFWYFVTKDRFTGLPLPTDVSNKEAIMWVDYVDDEQFMETISGNFLELVTPEGLFDMIDAGYNFMKREHHYGRFPLATQPAPAKLMNNLVSSAKRLSIPKFSWLPSPLSGVAATAAAAAASSSRNQEQGATTGIGRSGNLVF